jgi:Domain of unknown function (DUF4270)
MMMYAANSTRFVFNRVIILLAVSMVFMPGCDKVDVVFEDNDKLNDPNISYLENYPVTIFTYKTDSFVTSGSSTFMLGTHADSFFSKISAHSYAEITIPAENTVKDKDVSFDSLVLVLNPTGSYYGDTTVPLKLSVYRLSENIENEEETDNSYYYPRSFGRYAAPLAQSTAIDIKPNRKKAITIKLGSVLGQELLNKLKRDDDDIKTQEDFRDYFNGLCIVSDSAVNKTIFYFNSGSEGVLLRLHYKEKGAVTAEKAIGFGFNIQKQFNHIDYNSSGTPFAGFQQHKKQLKSSADMRGKAYISNNMPSYMKISFPDLLSLKELYPVISIVKAELEIKPAPLSARYPYKLPSKLRMFTSNSENNFDGVLLNEKDEEQTGNLIIDDLYGKNTHYRFDITSFINQVIDEGRYSTKSLFLSAGPGNSSSDSERLVVNEQSGKNGIKLKLYILGL